MRPQEGRLAIALFGPTAVGKSTVARRLADELGAASRHCGEEVGRIISERGVLSKGEHDQIDDDTRAFVSLSKVNVVVEGRFLHKVLVDVPGVRFVRLSCRVDERARRLREAGSNTTPSEEDAADERLMTDLYGSASAAPIAVDLWMDVDTTRISAEGTVALIVARLAGRPK